MNGEQQVQTRITRDTKKRERERERGRERARARERDERQSPRKKEKGTTGVNVILPPLISLNAGVIVTASHCSLVAVVRPARRKTVPLPTYQLGVLPPSSVTTTA